MALQFYNSLTRQVEEFKPIEAGKVRMYCCGPTVYNYQHIGNFRTFTWVDLLARYLRYKGYELFHVTNLTDVDDKIIRDSQKKGVSREEFVKPFVDAFLADFDALGLRRADLFPRATEYIEDMVELVQKLKTNGLAYEVNGSYYYKIAGFSDYGKFANLDMEGLKPGARVASDEYEKESVSDFALWKAWEPDDGDIYWETPLGKGRPGWHIECSVMSMKHLGAHFDIHAGGVDLIFPHHQNEIAQSEGATGERFVNYWLHGKHLIVEGRKMSKSLGNYYALRDIVEKGYSGKVVRHLLIATHYRQQLNFTFDGLEASRNALERYNDFIANLRDYPGGRSNGQADEFTGKMLAGFESALDDDLNISEALAAVFDFIRDINRLKSEDWLSAEERDRALEGILKVDQVLNFQVDEKSLDDEIEELIAQRTDARKRRDYARADKIRDDLLERGIILEDTPQGVKWKHKTL